MAQIYSAAAAAAAAAASASASIDDHRLLFVRLSQFNLVSNAYSDQYLCDISFDALSQNKVNVCHFLPSFGFRSSGGCCGGLLYLHDTEGKTLILNPITREFRYLPPSEVKRPANTNYSCYIACALGFDSQSNDYKVLRSMCNYFRLTLGGTPVHTSVLDDQFEIYSLKNDSWKVISQPNPNIGLISGCGVYVNNTSGSKCYWIAFYPFTSVIAFDFEKESFSSPIPIPPSLRTWSLKGSVDDLNKFDGMDIFEYKGSLAIIGYKKLGLNTLFDAWVLKEEEEEKWEEEFSVKVIGDGHKPLGFGKNGRSLFLKGNYYVENNKVGYQLLEYDVMDRCLKELPIFADDISAMQILSTSYDDPHANIFSGVVRKAVLQAANQFLQGSTEQRQGLQKIRAALGLSWMTKEEENRVTASRVLTSPGCKSDNGCKALGTFQNWKMA